MSTVVTELRVNNDDTRTTKSFSLRAEQLADRILLGAATLAEFAEGLSDDEWSRPVSASDRRTVGVIVHHVASMYPIETNAAQGIASGVDVSGITWEVIADINGKHAAEHSAIDKKEAIGLLLLNSQEAADVIRQFTDEQLDKAAPFGLSYGAPMTTQFVIEDHALRHSWHHLAKIRRAVGR